MKVESLEQLSTAFTAWRCTKRHVREAVPATLMDRAHRAIGVHGSIRVARATKLNRRRLERGCRDLGRTDGTPTMCVPSFSRLELPAMAVPSQPFAEVETPTGLRLRIFSETDGTIGLLASLCRTGAGAR